jgi:O-antigen/teichoic acid export membrane protein
VARSLGVLDYGKFSFALAFIALFSSFSDFGLSGITTREFSQDKERERHYSSILSLYLFLGFGSYIIIII